MLLHQLNSKLLVQVTDLRMYIAVHMVYILCFHNYLIKEKKLPTTTCTCTK